MRSIGSAAEGAAATRGASVLTGEFSGTEAAAALGSGAAGATSALTSRPPSNPQKLSWSSKVRLHFGHCFILISEKSLQPLTTPQASRRLPRESARRVRPASSRAAGPLRQSKYHFPESVVPWHE